MFSNLLVKNTCLFFILGWVPLLGACTQSMDTVVGTAAASDESFQNLNKRAAPIDATVPDVFETASFGLGWFWGIESQFGIVEGVIRTRVGYAGGEKSAPTYRAMGDHTETVQIDYDPNRISYDQLLDIFWASHQPTSRNWSRQYMNVIFYHDDRQQDLALASKKRVEQQLGRKVRSEVLPLRSFTMAEDYHQKYILKSHRTLKDEVTRMYPMHADLVASTAVARLNGYVDGHGSRQQLQREIDLLGLSENGRRVLEGLVRK